jgi:cell wall-associated NlpC family hydrolase
LPEVRERKKSDKIKGKGKGTGSSPAKNDVRRQMTAKLKKELVERQKGRSTGGATGQTPEVQAAEQVEASIYTTADSLRDHTADAVSKSIARYKRKQQKKKQRTEPATGEAAPADVEAPQPPQIRERAAGDLRTRPTENSRPADPVRERPAAPRSGMERTAAPPSPKERMRQNAIKEKRDRRTGPRQRPTDPKGQQPSVHGQATPASGPGPAQPKPQERMRQKAKAEMQTRRAKAERVSAPPRPERPPTPGQLKGSTLASPGNQSINPIKERPRRSFAPKEKPAGGSFIPKTRQTVAASKSTAKAASTAAKKQAAARPLAQAKRRVQRSAQRKLLQQSKAATKATLDLSRKAAVVTAKAVSSLISAIAGLLGGAFLIPIICLIILVGAIIASPFGILFSNEPTPGAMPLNVAVGQLNMELSNTLETLQTGTYSSVDIQGHGPDWREVVAVFAAKTAGADNGVDVAALTPDRVELLRAVFWDMCAVASEVETIPHPDSNPDDDTDDSWTETILHITITAKTAEDMRAEYAFSEYQNQALTELAAELATMDILLTDLSVSQEQARELLRNLPADLSPERRAAVETACQLVGKVNYFWGGKSRVIGWDSRWGTIQKVWAAGSSTSGTYLPYGLDCSGFVDWIFYNVSNGAYTIGHGGGARAQHTYCTAISWAEAQPGDLVFYPEDTHVGIVGGWDADGNILIIHCAYGYNNVVITKQEGFTTIGRPQYYSE